VIKRTVICDECGKKVPIDEQKDVNVLWEPVYIRLMEQREIAKDRFAVFKGNIRSKHYCKDHSLINLVVERDSRLLEAEREINEIIKKYFG